ncbi:MAG: spermidine synthase [Candidatus Omnitrophica bacterium]|nr:spermidine synthase [Candidatus Omnitrophota bacterium]
MMKNKTITGLKSVAIILAGMSGIGYEVLFFRLLTTYFGDMFYVQATLLSAFLLGVGIGSMKAHRFRDYLFLSQILIALYALSFPHILIILQKTGWLALTLNSSATISLLTAILLAVPSLLIGFSVPLFSAYLKTTNKKTFKATYILYNLGAFFGALAVELFLIRVRGITCALYINAGITAIVALIIAFCYRDVQTKIRDQVEQWIIFPRKVVVALGIASFASALFQMFFYKTCFHIFDTSRENFAFALAISMFAIFVGTILVKRFRFRFETCMLGAMLSLAIIFSNFKVIHTSFIYIWNFGKFSSFFHPLLKLIFFSLYGLLPLMFFGAMIPSLLIKEKNIAKESGYLLWVSCLGNALGYQFYIYFGHTYFSNVGLILCIGLLCLLACLIMFGMVYLKKRSFILLIIIIVMGVMVCNWDDKSFYLARPGLSKKYEKISENEFSLYKNGPDSVILTGDLDDLTLFYNGHLSIKIISGNKVALGEIAVGVFPALYVNDHSDALVLGLGSGITSGTVASIFQNTDIVEINKAFAQIQPRLKKANFNIVNNPNAHIYYSDARIFLTAKNKKYNAIISSVSRPDYFAASKLYTLEFYKQVSKSLKSGGVFCTWIDSTMGNTGFITVINTLRKVFKYCAPHQLRRGYYFLVCSNQPLKLKSFDDVAISDKVKEEISNNLPLELINEYFAYSQLSSNIFRKNPFANSRLLNSDDLPILEYAMSKELRKPYIIPDIFFLYRSGLNIELWRDSIEDKELTIEQKIYKSGALCLVYPYGEKYFLKRCEEFFQLEPELASKQLEILENEIIQSQGHIGNEPILDALASFNLMRKNKVKAVKYLREILSLNPLDRGVHRKLAMIYESGELENKELHFKHKLYVDFIGKSAR